MLDGVAEAVEGAHARVAAPGKDQFPRASHAYELVVDQVRRHPDEGEVSPSLAHDLVGRGGRYQMGEPFQGNRVAVAHEFGDRLAQLDLLFRQPRSPSTGPQDGL